MCDSETLSCGTRHTGRFQLLKSQVNLLPSFPDGNIRGSGLAEDALLVKKNKTSTKTRIRADIMQVSHCEHHVLHHSMGDLLPITIS